MTFRSTLQEPFPSTSRFQTVIVCASSIHPFFPIVSSSRVFRLAIKRAISTVLLMSYEKVLLVWPALLRTAVSFPLISGCVLPYQPALMYNFSSNVSCFPPKFPPLDLERFRAVVCLLVYHTTVRTLYLPHSTIPERWVYIKTRVSHSFAII